MLKLNPVLFWDIDFKEIDFEKNARQVIERVLTKGTVNDWFEIKSFYGIDRIKAEALKCRSLDKVTLNFCSKYFNVSKNQFRCYNTPQSTQKLWNY